MVDCSLNKNNIYIYPTDTVWGIGGNALSNEVVGLVHKIKGSRDSKPLSIVFKDIEEFKIFISTDDNILGLICDVCELGVTFLLPRKWVKSEILCENICSNSPFIGIRILNVSWKDRYDDLMGRPLISTSLNRAGNSPILNEADARQFQGQFCKDSILICENQSSVKTGQNPSTIVKYDQKKWDVIREGDNCKKIIQKLNAKV